MTVNIQLTKNFWLAEYFIDSDDPPAAERLYNECVDFQVSLSYALALDQQKMRDFINEMKKDGHEVKITNTSGYRDPGLNAAQPGAAARSLHTKMRAVDFKTAAREHLLKIYKFITVFSDLDFRECFLYITAEGIPTNIHYAKKAPGFVDRRYGIYVRPAGGGKPVRHDRYIATLAPHAPFAARLKTIRM